MDQLDLTRAASSRPPRKVRASADAAGFPGAGGVLLFGPFRMYSALRS
jgi:hypothetical protein